MATTARERAIAALRAGDRGAAYEGLRAHLAEAPQDVAAWLWLSEAAATPTEQAEALAQVLARAPTHPHAARIAQRLAELRATVPPPVPDAPPPALPHPVPDAPPSALPSAEILAASPPLVRGVVWGSVLLAAATGAALALDWRGWLLPF